MDKPKAHDIALSSNSRTVADSAGLGWREAFASITLRRAWVGQIAPSEHLGLVYCLRGVNRVERRLEGEHGTRAVTFRARELALMPLRAPAWYRVNGDADVLSLYLRGGMVRAVADRLFGASTKPLGFQTTMCFHDPLLEQLCLAFASALDRRDPATPYLDQLAESAAAHCLVRHGAFASPGSSEISAASEFEQALRRVRAYVDENLDGDLSVETLADEAGLSESGLKRAFAFVHGATPRQWIIQRRIARAERLLAATDLPLAEIAFRTGFASQSHLSLMFKRETGSTPKAYRRVG